jgi:hypothetical protein
VSDEFYRRGGKRREYFDFAFRTKSVNLREHFTTKIFANRFADKNRLQSIDDIVCDNFLRIRFSLNIPFAIFCCARIWQPQHCRSTLRSSMYSEFISPSSLSWLLVSWIGCSGHRRRLLRHVRCLLRHLSGLSCHQRGLALNDDDGPVGSARRTRGKWSCWC